MPGGGEMFSKVLDCPNCGNRFSYEHEGTVFPEQISCPKCGESKAYKEFSALLFCQECRAKLRVPLDILFDADLSCPDCGTLLNANATYLEDTAASTLSSNGVDRRQLYKRMLQDGEVFDKYQIIRLLGKGGMAEVYLAEHLLLKQQCALKLMRSGMNSDDPVYVKRFLREAKISHKCNHPNIVKVYDVGSDFKTGYLFIAMEYVEGKTLYELTKDQKFSEEELTDILKSMAGALSALMELKVVHRDIKPSNIMRDINGVYKLMDLGIAKSENNQQSGDVTLTMEQSSIGTPNYASPEQCRAAHRVDYRTDIYSLGASLYHIASGKLPFSGATPVETIINVMQCEAEPLKNLRPDLSGKLVDLIEKMMKKKPEERPASPEALLEELNKVGEKSAAGSFCKIVDTALGGKNASTGSEAGKTNRSLVIKSAAAAVVVLLLMTVGIVLGINLGKGKPAAGQIAEKSVVQSEQKVEIADKKSLPPTAEKNTADHKEKVAVAAAKPVADTKSNPEKAAGQPAESRKIADNSTKTVVKTAVKKAVKKADKSSNPEKAAAAEPAKKIAEVPAVKSKPKAVKFVLSNAPGSLTNRLKSCIEQLEKVKNSTPKDTETIAFLEKQKKVLEGQIEYRRKNHELKNTYNTAEATLLTDILTKFDKHYDDLNESQLEELEKNIYNQLKKSSVDPDIEFGTLPLPLYLAENSDGFSLIQDFLELFHEKYSDGNMILKKLDDSYQHLKLNYWEEGFLLEWYRQGVEDIDKEKVFSYLSTQSLPPVIGFAGSCVKLRDFELKPVDFTRLKQFLLLRPVINNLTDVAGKTLMHYAAEYNDAELAKMLLASGFTCSKNTDNNGITPWQSALRTGSKTMVKFLHERKMNFQDNNADRRQYKFWMAVEKSDLNTVRNLLRYHVNPYWYNSYGVNALQYACMKQDIKLAKVLLDHNINPKTYIDRFRHDNNPIQMAIQCKNLDLFRLLLKAEGGLTADDRLLFHTDVESSAVADENALGLYLIDSALTNQWTFEEFRTFFELLQQVKSFDINYSLNNYTMLTLACLAGKGEEYSEDSPRTKMVNHLVSCGAQINVNYQGKPLKEHFPELKKFSKKDLAGADKPKKQVDSITEISSRTAEAYTKNVDQLAEKHFNVCFQVKRLMRCKFKDGEFWVSNSVGERVGEISSGDWVVPWKMKDPIQLPLKGDYYIRGVEVLACNRQYVFVAYNANAQQGGCRIRWSSNEIEVIDKTAGSAEFELRVTFAKKKPTGKGKIVRSANHRRLKDPKK